MSKKNVKETVEVPAKSSASEQLWNKIKTKKIDVFAKVGRVEDYCTYVPISPDKCYLTMKVSAVLPALELALGADYMCTLDHKYIMVEKVVKLG